MAVTYYQSNRILNKLFSNTDPSPTWPTTLYFGLCRSQPLVAGTTTPADEQSGSGYARVAVVNSSASFNVAASGALTTKIAIQFPESTVDWLGPITHIFISDASTGGNVLYYEALSPTRTVLANTTVYFEIGGITLQMVN